MLSIKGLEKTFSERNSSFKLKIDNLTINSNGMVFILGKSGSGKSTFLNLLGLIDEPDNGEIIFGNIDILKLSELEKSHFRATEIGFVFQNFNLFEDLTVKENIETALDISHSSNNIKELLTDVGLDNFKNRKIKYLSGGQKQRVAIARSILKNPKILLCDEPTGSLDNKNANRIMSILKEISSRSLVIVVSHNRELANQYADEIIEMKDGEIAKKSMINFSKNTDNCELLLDNKKDSGHLSNKNSFKLALRFFKKRTFSYIVATIVSAVSFGSFLFNGSLKNTDFDSVISNAIANNAFGSLSIEQTSSYVDLNTGISGHSKVLNNVLEEDAVAIREELKVSRVDILKLSNVSINSNYLKPISLNEKKHNPMYYKRISGFLTCDSETLEDYGFTLLSGNLPSSNNEIMITKYRFNSFVNYGYKNENITIENVTKDNLIGKSIELTEINGNKNKYVIAGIVDTGEYFGNYLKNAYVDYSVTVDEDISKELRSSIHNAIFCKNVDSIELINSDNSTFCIPINNDAIAIKEKLKLIQKYKRVITVNNDGVDIELTKDLTLVENQYIKCLRVKTNLSSISQLLNFIQFVLITLSLLFVFLHYLNLTFNQRKEFGILKCLGISKNEIIKIMGLHGLISSSIFCLISFAFTAVSFALTNPVIAGSIGISSNLLSLNWIYILFTIIAVFIITMIGIYVPLFISMRKTTAKLIKD